jgi:L-lactate utilization protein LutC
MIDGRDGRERIRRRVTPPTSSHKSRGNGTEIASRCEKLKVVASVTSASAAEILKKIASEKFNVLIEAEKTKYMITSRHTNSGQNQNIRIANGLFENVATFKYFGTTLTNQNDIHDEIESKLNSGNTCYYSFHNLLSSRLISKNL